MAFVTNLLAAWRIGAQATLLDYRLTPFEIDRALERVAPQVVVAPKAIGGTGLRAFFDVEETVSEYPGSPAGTAHAVIQLSSGSTGPSKVIGRSAANLVEEIHRQRVGLVVGSVLEGGREEQVGRIRRRLLHDADPAST